MRAYVKADRSKDKVNNSRAEVENRQTLELLNQGSSSRDLVEEHEVD